MEYYHSKKSSIRGNNAVVYEALDRGHKSDITRVKKPDKTTNGSDRRMFQFIGSAGSRHHPQHKQKAPLHPPPAPSRSRTPSKMGVSPKTRTPINKHVPRSRTQSATKHKPSSATEHSTKGDYSSASKVSVTKRDRSSVSRVSQSKEDRSSRSTSLNAKKNSSRSSSANSKSGKIISEEIRKSKPSTPIEIQIPSPEPAKGAISPAILVNDEQEIDIKDKHGSPILASISSSDEDDKAEEEEVSFSPSVVGYRKLVYNEKDDKWIEYWKIEEDAKRAAKKAKIQKLLKKLEANKHVPKPHPVKGRITSKIQIMFPTAIVKPEKRHGGVLYHSILMTDPLRIELHKRRAPIVPTYFQEHIAKFGKLPFRNNPRPHPIV